MKTILSLYRFAEKKNIAVIPFSLPETGSMSLCDADGNCYIAMDNAAYTAGAEQRVHLGHELGHCVTGSFYSRYTAVDSRQRHENRADKWAIRKLIPAAALDDAVAQGHTELWDLAEFFGVTEEFMQKAVCLYTYGSLATEMYF